MPNGYISFLRLLFWSPLVVVSGSLLRNAGRQGSRHGDSARGCSDDAVDLVDEFPSAARLGRRFGNFAAGAVGARITQQRGSW